MENNRNVLIVCVYNVCVCGGGGEGGTMKCGGGGVGWKTVEMCGVGGGKR